jgi:NADH-quinone oxidoreductase subunit D
MTETTDAYAPSRQTTEGRVYNLTGGDWDEMLARVAGADPLTEERLVLNMGPQHPSTHGVLRLVLELEGETVTDARVVVGYLHTGIEKNAEYRTWTQAVTFLTRADYLAPFFNETAYCLGVERLLGVEAPSRAQLIRVLMMEINRLSSHWVWLATGGMELGALTAMTNGFRARERCLDIFEMITGLRMNHAYVRPGGVAQDLPDGYDGAIREWIKEMRVELAGVDKLLRGQTVWVNRLKDVGWIGVEGCIALGVTGPLLRAAGLPWDLRKTEPYLGYETFDFEVPTDDRGDCWSRFVVRVAEMWESLKIVEQVLNRLEPGPTMIDDPKIAWPAKLSLGPDGLGNSLPHVQKIMNTSMEALIHHFKLVTEGFRVPPGQVYQPVESPRGELGAHIVSDGGTRPYRVHFREPSFINLQATAALSVGGMIADVIASVASIDPVMGGCDR